MIERISVPVQLELCDHSDKDEIVLLIAALMAAFRFNLNVPNLAEGHHRTE